MFGGGLNAISAMGSPMAGQVSTVGIDRLLIRLLIPYPILLLIALTNGWTGEYSTVVNRPLFIP